MTESVSAFWAGAAAGILGGAVTGLFALGASFINSRSESRRQLARERRAAYAELIAASERLNMLMILRSTALAEDLVPPDSLSLDRMVDEFDRFRGAVSAAVVVASTRAMGLVQRMGSALNSLAESLGSSDLSAESLENLRDPMYRLMDKVRAVFTEEVRFELDVGEAGVLKRWTIRKNDPSERLMNELKEVLDDILTQGAESEEE